MKPALMSGLLEAPHPHWGGEAQHRTRPQADLARQLGLHVRSCSGLCTESQRDKVQKDDRIPRCDPEGFNKHVACRSYTDEDTGD